MDLRGDSSRFKPAFMVAAACSETDGVRPWGEPGGETSRGTLFEVPFGSLDAMVLDGICGGDVKQAESSSVLFSGRFKLPAAGWGRGSRGR